jgi:hypothetical protein
VPIETTILDPRPSRGARIIRLADRLTTLDGAVLAIVNNGKQHAGDLLQNILDLLHARWTISGIVHLGPPSPGYGGNAKDAIAAAKWATAAITGIGDCGSCASGTLMDALLFERINIPAIPVVTSPFAPSVRALAQMNGARNYIVATIDHPIAGLNRAELSDRALQALPTIVAALTRNQSSIVEDIQL